MDLFSNLVIDRVLRIGGLSSTDGELLWLGNQVTECTFASKQDNTQVTDAIGTTIAYLGRAKGLDVSATSKTFDFGIAAAQWGASRMVSSAVTSIMGTVFDEHTITAAEVTAGKITLKHIPHDIGAVAGTGLKYLYKLNSQGHANTKYTYGAAASASAFTYTTGSAEITLPTGAYAAGDVAFCAYVYEADDSDVAMSITNESNVFPTSCKGLVECLFRDPCDNNTMIYGYFIIPKCKLDGNFSFGLASDATHDFKLLSESDYCGSTGRQLIQVFVPDYA